MLFFWKLAPYIGSLLPETQWTAILKFVVYLIVGYIGGISIPLIILILILGVIVIVRSI